MDLLHDEVARDVERHKGRRVIMLIDGLNIRILTEDGELLQRLTLDPSRGYQPQRKA